MRKTRLWKYRELGSNSGPVRCSVTLTKLLSLFEFISKMRILITPMGFW